MARSLRVPSGATPSWTNGEVPVFEASKWKGAEEVVRLQVMWPADCFRQLWVPIEDPVPIKDVEWIVLEVLPSLYLAL